MIFSRRLIPQIAAFIAGAVMMTASAHADVILTLSGTTSHPTLTATVNNSDSFTASSVFGTISWFLLPNTFDIFYTQDGPSGGFNPDVIRAAGDGSSLNLISLSIGDGATIFTLDASHPYSTSGIIGGSSVSSLAVLNGVTSTMNVKDGTGPTTKVTFIYDVSAAPSVPEPSSFLMMFTGVLPGLGVVLRKRRVR